jgi:hypothetical protein
MNPLAKLNFLIVEEVCEPIAWRIEYYFGKNCFWFARVILFVGTCLIVLRNACNDGAFQALCYIPFNVSGSFVVAWFIDENESSVTWHPLTLNPWKTWWWMCLWVSCFDVFLVYVSWRHDQTVTVKTLNVLANIAFPISIYFASCNPMPPKWVRPKE